MKSIKEIRAGDIVFYRSGRINNVNKPENYKKYFNDNFENPWFGKRMDIMKIKRYVKVLWFYVLKTIYVRSM